MASGTWKNNALNAVFILFCIDILDKNFDLFHLKQYFMNFHKSSHRKCSVKKVLLIRNRSLMEINLIMIKNSLPETFLWKSVLKICSKYTGKHPRWSDFNKVVMKLYWNRTSTRVSSCKFAAHFQNTFSLEHLWRATSVLCTNLERRIFLYAINHQNVMTTT